MTRGVQEGKEGYSLAKMGGRETTVVVEDIPLMSDWSKYDTMSEGKVNNNKITMLCDWSRSSRSHIVVAAAAVSEGTRPFDPAAVFTTFDRAKVQLTFSTMTLLR